MSASESAVCPMLQGDGLMLEPLVERHAVALFDLVTGPDIVRYQDDPGPATLTALKERYRRWETRQSADGSELWLNWAVAAPPHGIVGFVQATVFRARSSADIAYVIGKPFWSRGFGTRAVRALVRFLRDDLAIATAAATIDDRNVPSLRLAAALGFRVVDARDPRNVRLELALSRTGDGES